MTCLRFQSISDASGLWTHVSWLFPFCFTASHWILSLLWLLWWAYSVSHLPKIVLHFQPFLSPRSSELLLGHWKIWLVEMKEWPYSFLAGRSVLGMRHHSSSHMLSFTCWLICLIWGIFCFCLSNSRIRCMLRGTSMSHRHNWTHNFWGLL